MSLGMFQHFWFRRCSQGEAFDFDYNCQRVVERGMGRLNATLLIMLTFGIAAPALGFACAFAAVITVVHHVSLLSQLSCVCESSKGRLPDLEECHSIPVACGGITLATACFIWTCGALGYVQEWAALGGATLAAVLFSILLLVVHRVTGSCGPIPGARHRGSSSSSAARGLLLESLLESEGDSGLDALPSNPNLEKESSRN